MRDDIWIGLAHAIPNDINSNVFNDPKGAFVNVVGHAATVNTFKDRVSNALRDLDLNLIEIEDVEKFDDRIRRVEVDINILTLVSELTDDYLIKFSSFHTYPIKKNKSPK